MFLGVNILDGISKAIEELGIIILEKNAELRLKQKEIDDLKTKIESIEAYLDAYAQMYDCERYKTN